MTASSVLENPSNAQISRKLSSWSATPTPLTTKGGIDVDSVRRMITRHIQLGCEGVMLAGTCGEGPWLRQSDIETLVRTGVEQAEGALEIAVQVTDNSPRLILERLENVARWGGGMGVIAQPYFLFNATPDRVKSFYLEVLDQTPLPIFYYDRGKAASVPVPLESLEDILSHPKVLAIKDSSTEPERYAIMQAVRKLRPELRIYSGDEFQLMEAVRAGYDGAFFGGMIMTGLGIKRCFDLYAENKQEAADELDSEIKKFLLDIYGGPKITCWLSGLKYALVRMGVFSEWDNILEYPLTQECREAVDQAVEKIDWLRP